MARNKQPKARPAQAPKAKPSDRRWILELLDGSRARQQSAFPDSNIDELVYFAHLSAVRQLTEIYYRRLLKPYQISYSEYRVLSALRVRGRDYRATPQDLNHVAQITSAGMTRTLDRLEQAKYIERLPNPSDRRSILIGLTQHGWDFAEALNTDLAAQFSELLGDVSTKALKAETDQLRTVVERLTNAVVAEADA